MKQGIGVFFALFFMAGSIYAQGITIWAEKFEPYGYIENGKIYTCSARYV